ncbi:MAG: SGNH/GDSL hydrolase family protein, partial [Anaerolineae bacterium]|nr:SGNH/GDSL hydrolase family protein [Anaerolineae bacterium]
RCRRFFGAWLLIGAIVLFYAVTNWQWLTDNVTSTGWDKPRHLARSLQYHHLLSQPSIQSLFAVVVGDPVRTPLFPASATIMYRLFGRDPDVAAMVNILYLAVALAAAYGIGRRWRGPALGLIAVALLALFPMYYSMSRYFYIEFALAAMTTLTVYLLLTTDGFKRRGASLLFGLSLGLTLLTKRTSALFVAGPILAVILLYGLLPILWRQARAILALRDRKAWLRYLRNAALALLIGLLPAAIWYLPNRQAVHGLYLGDALFFAWWLLAAATAYCLLLPSGPLSNGLAALFLGAGLASTWYLARITEFLQRITLYGYGIDDQRGRTLNLGDVDTYLYYLRKLVNEHLSPPIAILFLIVLAIAIVAYVRRRGSLRQAVRRVKPEAWVVLAWIAGGYLFLTLSIYQETRAFTPALPAVALLFGAALLALPWRRVALVSLAAVLLFGLLQFFVVSWEPAYRLLTPQTLHLPVWGRTSLFAQGVYIQLPDEGRTDRGYAIYPDVLQRMEARRQALGQDILTLGLLANMSQINAGPFNLLILTDYPSLRVDSLIERFNPQSPYHDIFGFDYLAVKKVNSGMNPVQEELIGQLLDDPPALFSQLFELETSYLMPGGDTVYLYRQRYHLPAGYHAQQIIDLAGQLSARAGEGDAILLTPPELAAPFTSHYTGAAEIALAPASGGEMAALADQYARLFLAIGDAKAGQAQGLARDWLNLNGFYAAHEWVGGLELLTYGLVPTSSLPMTQTTGSGAVWGDQVKLTGYDLPIKAWQGGDVVPLTLFWQAPQALPADYTIFLHLVGPDGQIVAQTDSAPAGGSRPASGWQPGETVVDRHGLLLPATVAPGEYQLRLGLYLSSTGERLPVVGPAGKQLGDSMLLSRITVCGEGGACVAFTGDSLTRGDNSTDSVGFAGFLSQELGWQPVRCVWFHISEATAKLDQIGQVDLIVVEHGVHAITASDKEVSRDPAEFRRLYGALLDKALSLSPDVVAVNIPFLLWDERHAAKAAAYNQILYEEAAARGIPVADAWAPLQACGQPCFSADNV